MYSGGGEGSGDDVERDMWYTSFEPSGSLQYVHKSLDLMERGTCREQITVMISELFDNMNSTLPTASE